MKGVHAVVPTQRSVPSRLIDPKIKNRSRIYYQIANLQAQKVDAEAWALLTDEDGFLTEGTGSNFFVVKDGGLLTAEPRNILRGVTRQAVLELAESLGLSCRECNLEPYDVMTADEAFSLRRRSRSCRRRDLTGMTWVMVNRGRLRSG